MLLKAFGIDLIAQHMNGMTQFDLVGYSGKLGKIHVRILDSQIPDAIRVPVASITAEEIPVAAPDVKRF